MRITIQKTFCLFLLAFYMLAPCLSYAEWQSSYYLDHPLTGKIYSLAEESFVAEDELVTAIKATQFLLLGEKHTNHHHHIGQARIIQQWLPAEQNPALVLEMLEIDTWPHSGKVWADRSELTEQLELLAKDWDWEIYQPVIELAIMEKLPIFPANLSRKTLSARYADGSSCELMLGEKSMQICDTINQEKRSAINQLIFDAHCGYVPNDKLAPLVNTQIAKDAAFALSMVNAGEHRRAVLITGAVHARKDIGVPVHLKKLGFDSLSIVFKPVDPARLKPQEYFDQHLAMPYEYVFFTPSERNTDPCVEFAEQLKRMKQHQ